uniref:Uncharacterized protein n=1 Tax=Lepeophtheirus salmonis TaxID=72036 RepID=A0A0K2UQW5_LEPSM
MLSLNFFLRLFRVGEWETGLSSRDNKLISEKESFINRDVGGTGDSTLSGSGFSRMGSSTGKEVEGLSTVIGGTGMSISLSSSQGSSSSDTKYWGWSSETGFISCSWGRRYASTEE